MIALGSVAVDFLEDGERKTKSVLGHAVKEAPGLAVTPSLSKHQEGYWRVTHVPSGWSAIPLAFSDPDDAYRVAQRLGPLTDWSVAGSALQGQSDVGAAIARICADELAIGRAVPVRVGDQSGFRPA